MATKQRPVETAGEAPERASETVEGAPGGAEETPRTDRTSPSTYAREGWQDRFIAALKVTPVIVTACKRAGVSRSRAYTVRGENPDFAAAWQAALEDGIDEVEQAAIEVALTGDEEMTCKYRPDGSLESCTLRRWRSRGHQDRALILKANRPEKYRDRYEVRHTDSSELDRDIQQLVEDLNLKPVDKGAGHPEKMAGEPGGGV